MIKYGAMQLHKWNEIPEEQLTPLVTRQMLHGSSITIARLRMRKGSLVPTHSHVNEQITTIEAGSMLFVTPAERIIVRAGESLRIPPNVRAVQRVEPLEDLAAVDTSLRPETKAMAGRRRVSARLTLDGVKGASISKISCLTSTRRHSVADNFRAARIFLSSV